MRGVTSPLIAAFLLILFGALASVFASGSPGNADSPDDAIAHVRFTRCEEALVNPYMGYAPWADGLSHTAAPEPDVTLAFALLFWREIEPAKGVYDFEAFERRNNLDHLRSHQIRLIIRVVADYPRAYPDVDIPMWLFQEMDGAGIYYHDGHLAGFIPDYANAYLMERHALLIRALAERYDDPNIVAFVELGTLGHWGEWHHTLAPEADFPGRDVTDVYARHYMDAFINAKLLLRRPVPEARHFLGFYNDMMGSYEATAQWLDWISDANMKNFYTYAPSGGEFASSEPMETYFSDKFAEVKEMLVASNTTFIASQPPRGHAYETNVQDLLKAIGYRFVAREATYTRELPSGGEMNIELTLANEGIAPFYFPWNFCYDIVDSDGEISQRSRSQCLVTEMQPGQLRLIDDSFPLNVPPGDYTLTLGLVSPYTGHSEVRFANIETDGEGRLVIGTINAH